jgi:hypothetical protein
MSAQNLRRFWNENLRPGERLVQNLWNLRQFCWLSRRILEHIGQVSWRKNRRVVMGLGRGALLWLIGVPLPVIILIALFWHH